MTYEALQLIIIFFSHFNKNVYTVIIMIYTDVVEYIIPIEVIANKYYILIIISTVTNKSTPTEEY